MSDTNTTERRAHVSADRTTLDGEHDLILEFTSRDDADNMVARFHFWGVHANLIPGRERYLVHAYPSYRSSL